MVSKTLTHIHDVHGNAHGNFVPQTITLDCEAMPVLQIKTFRQKSGKVETSHYKATVSRLRARLSIALSYNTFKGDMRVEGFPDVSKWKIVYVESGRFY